MVPKLRKHLALLFLVFYGSNGTSQLMNNRDGGDVMFRYDLQNESNAPEARMLQWNNAYCSKWCDWCGNAGPETDITLTEYSQYKPFHVRVPKTNYVTEAKKYPLLLTLHGYGVCPLACHSYLAYMSMDDAPFNMPVISVVPEGLVGFAGKIAWNAMPNVCCQQDPTVDDVGYLKAVVAETLKRYPNADPDRVFCTGYSNGAMMCNRLACEAPEVLAGVMALAGQLHTSGPGGHEVKCKGTYPVPMLSVWGSDDMTVRYDGYQPLTGLTSPGGEQNFKNWLELNKCDTLGESDDYAANCDKCPEGELDLLPEVGSYMSWATAGAKKHHGPGFPDAALETRVYRGKKCPDGGSVEHWEIRGGGHGPWFADKNDANLGPGVFYYESLSWLLKNARPAGIVQASETPPSDTGASETSSSGTGDDDASGTASGAPSVNDFLGAFPVLLFGMVQSF
eukprot:gnl/MRDRNA2_/MRDRNA2_36989_c0_seq1.p1 gnl/MRDRNA2_/MRDRNA2_36989_c0~~gnl/MRDRNA2_/MRDRNA2_36989_c0_seq1.p1  ORF type:complete len:488 (+),score=80.10 gnl/MRDRNA2_/MRDRNA2_36989_c0_seq1:114-1466(+)